ncbi:phospholipase D-like domain-containing protein [Rhizobium sp. BK313]|uniref:phospholipase D-like domain-containing protein n=1 Tax=Rhizobium sp. BK313 TaxID=2587081 RepID=UPI0039183DCD
MRFVIALLLVFANTQSVLATQPVAAKVSVCFTSSEQCEDQIVAEIDRARASIRVQAYGFTSLPIIHALQRAAGRGVEVLAILDKTNERKYSVQRCSKLQESPSGSTTCHPSRITRSL